MSYDFDDAFIPAHHQPALLIDLAASHDVNHHRLLRGSGIFLDDILTGERLISPAQFHWMVNNAQQLFHSQDISFLFGQRCILSPFSDAAQSILYACSLRDALQRYQQFAAIVSPLLSPRISLSAQHVHIYWLDENDPKKRFLIESVMSALNYLSRHLLGEKLPWKYEFNHAAPDYIEQYWAHLGDDLNFERAMNMMSLPVHYLDIPLRQASITTSLAAFQKASKHIAQQQLNQSFLDMLYQFLLHNIQRPISLEASAEQFGMSPASLKRKLQKQHTHFQAQVDQARLHTAVMLYRVKGYKTEQVAQHLNINDTTNFRRAFKRWSGLPIQSAY
jgi:AraC-like DNA-binding protein